MRITAITLFPQMMDACLSESIVARARRENIITLDFVNPRDFTADKHKTVDDRPYGGGAGMVMMVEPLYKAHQSVKTPNSHTILLGPRGKTFKQQKAKELTQKEHLILICGHYEGIDERVYSFVDEEISIGDYILTGGELAACVVTDSVTRLMPNVFKKEGVTEKESFSQSLLEAAQYTRPQTWHDISVPQVLLNGNHKEIENWRLEEAIKLTKKIRPDLLKEEN